MKKLMMTTVAALGFAVCAKAADGGVLNSTGFERYGDNKFDVGRDDQGTGDNARYWLGTGDFTQTVLAKYGEDPVPANVPDAFTNAANTTFLSVDTGNDVLLRRAATDPTQTLALTNGPVFFDANVKFTASESDVVPSEGDKLLVWLKGDENSQTTNLVVTAGLYNESTEAYDQTNFTVVGDYAADTWYRLTVKAAVDDNNLTYFNVYIDGEPVEATDKTTDFYSLVQTGVNKYVIAEAGFQGTGALDNVVWTTTDPFYVETEEFTVNVTLTDDGGAVGEWTFNGEDASGFTNVTTNIEVADDAEIVVTLTVYESVTVAATIDGETVADANITSAAGEEEATIYTITLSGAGYADGDTVELAITVTKSDSPTPVVPETAETVPGTPVQVKAADADVAVGAVTVQGVNGTVYEASQKYYTKTAVATETEGVFEVTVTLNETELDKDVDAAVEAALEAVKAGATSVALPAGFYYKVESGSALPIATTATGTTGGSEIEVKGLTEAAGFFKVSVGTTNFAE